MNAAVTRSGLNLDNAFHKTGKDGSSGVLGSRGKLDIGVDPDESLDRVGEIL